MSAKPINSGYVYGSTIGDTITQKTGVVHLRQSLDSIARLALEISRQVGVIGDVLEIPEGELKGDPSHPLSVVQGAYANLTAIAVLYGLPE